MFIPWGTEHSRRGVAAFVRLVFSIFKRLPFSTGRRGKIGHHRIMLVQVLTQHDLQELALLAVGSHLTIWPVPPGFIGFHRVYFVVSLIHNRPRISVLSSPVRRLGAFPCPPRPVQ